MSFSGLVQCFSSCEILYLDIARPDSLPANVLDGKDDIERGPALFEALAGDLEAHLRRGARRRGVDRQRFNLTINLSEFAPQPATFLRKLCASDIPIPRLGAPSDHLGGFTNLQHPLK